MKLILARAVNLICIIITIIFAAIIYKGNFDGELLGWAVFWYGLVAGLNYLMFGKPTLWNPKE